MKREEILITEIENKILDENQAKCVNSNEKNILAVAGAGCGKTTTLLARIKYLTEIKKANPEEMLILSFTNSTTTELKEKIKDTTNKNIDVFTFHKLGKKIINSVDGYEVTLYENKISGFVSNYIDKKLKEGNYFEFYDFLINHYHEYLSFKNFKHKEDEYKYIKDKGIVSLDNEYKMTFEENSIANLLYLNNIDYEYFMTNPKGNEFKKLCSGFYLPEYQKYLFNINIDKNGFKPLWGYPKNERIAHKNYDAYIFFLNNYNEFKNKSIFTYSYEFENGQFIDNFYAKLENENIIRRFSYENTNKNISKLFAYNIGFIKKLVANFITLMKTTSRNGNDILNLKKWESEEEKNRAYAFYKIVLPIYDAYEKFLSKNNMIDFNDMILKATSYVKKDLFVSKYKYILIDEFQDISSSRMELVDAIYQKNNCELFAVGDDYQSIFRFTGSDINIFYDFKKEYKAKEYIIENNYRFDKNIAKVSNQFILKNPYQIKKELKSNKVGINSIRFIESPNKNGLYKAFLKAIYSLPKNSEVMLIGRYNKDIITYAKTNEVDLTIDENGKINIEIPKRKDLKITFLTVHKAKGLECDYVFILNTFNHLMGFPCNISDDKLIKMLLKNKEDFPYSEERRLFYVAMTRAKEKLFIMVNRNSMSPFIKEIINYKGNSNLFL